MSIELLPTAICLAAVVCDLRSREIPDSLSAAAAITGIGAGLVNLTALPFWESLLSAGVVFLVTAVLALRGGFGGGDVKLMAGLATWLAIPEAVAFLFWTAISGMLLSVVAAIRKQRDLAYCPAIFVGFTLAVYMPGLLPGLVETIRETLGVR